jgi:dTDP-4-amino-4,6-dideoxygalactose transaminase
MQFIDLEAQQQRLQPRIDQAIARVLQHGKFIMGPEVHELESRLSGYCGVKEAVTCSNGTDALVLALRALGVAAGDAVLVPSFTFAATAEAVVLVGAVPVFVDCDERTFNLDPDRIGEAVRVADQVGLTARAIIPVDLFGQPADYDAVGQAAAEHGLDIVADAAQSFGATWNGRRAGSLGRLATTSFFPAKPLGCYGDGGAVLTDDPELAAVLRSLRVHGQGSHKYENVRIGMNARLDTVQAAILLEKLDIFDSELQARQEVAGRYSAAFGDQVLPPVVRTEALSAWAQYTVLVDQREAVAERLKAAGIPTAVYYPLPLHLQTAYRPYPVGGALPVTERLAGQVLSLPMHPYLDEESQARVVDAVRSAVSVAA